MASSGPAPGLKVDRLTLAKAAFRGAMGCWSGTGWGNRGHMSSSAVCTEEASEDREGPFGQDKTPRETQTEQKCTCSQLRYPVLPYEAEGHDHRQQEEDHHAQRRPLHLHSVSLWRDTFIAILPDTLHHPEDLWICPPVKARQYGDLTKSCREVSSTSEIQDDLKQSPTGPRGPEVPTVHKRT